MNAGAGLAALAGLGALLAFSGRRAPRDMTAAAEAAFRAPDNVAREPSFVAPEAPRGRVLLPTAETSTATDPATGKPVERAVRTAGMLNSERPDPRRARALAGRLARALRTSGPSPLARRDVSVFQQAAGLTPHGLYTPATQAALRRYGIRNAPEAWFSDEQKGAAA